VTRWKRTKPYASAVGISGQFDSATLKQGKSVKTARWVNLWWSSMGTPNVFPGKVSSTRKPLLSRSTITSQFYQAFASVDTWTVSILNISKSHRFGLN
jgi:hypothetical protein